MSWLSLRQCHLPVRNYRSNSCSCSANRKHCESRLSLSPLPSFPVPRIVPPLNLRISGGSSQQQRKLLSPSPYYHLSRHDLKNNKISYPQTGTTRRVIFGSFFTILGEAIGVLKHILLVPLFLRAWGKIIYGEWLTVYALVSYLPLVDIGMQNYVINRLTQKYSEGDIKEFNKIFQSALRLYLIIIFVVSLSFLFFISFVPFNKWFNITFTSNNTIKLTAFILGIYLLSGILSGLLTGLYHSFGEYPRRALLADLKEIIFISLIATALLLKSNFVVIASLHFIPLFILISYCLFDIKRRHREIQFGFSKASWKLSFSFIIPGLLFLMITLAYTLKIQGSILVISSILGTGAVAIFSVHRTLANLISKVINSINCAIWPELTAADTRKDYKKMQKAFYFLIKLSLFLSFSFAVFLFFTGKDIIRIWTRNRIEFQPILWLFFLIYLPFTVFWETSGIFQLSTNKHKKYALARLTSAILGIILAIFLTKSFGLLGALLGFIISEGIICGTIVPSETLKITRADKKEFWFNTVGKGFIIILPQILIAWFLSNYVSNIFLQWILLVFAIFLIGAIIGYLFWLTEEERKKLWIIKSYIKMNYGK